DILSGNASRTAISLTGKGSLNEVVVQGKPAPLFKVDGKPRVGPEGRTFGYEQGQNKGFIGVRGYVETRVMTVTIPAGSKLDIESGSGDVVIGMSADEAKLNISNGTLDAQDFKTLRFTGKYCNANFGDIQKGEIEFSNGTFKAVNIGDLDLDTKS